MKTANFGIMLNFLSGDQVSVTLYTQCNEWHMTIRNSYLLQLDQICSILEAIIDNEAGHNIPTFLTLDFAIDVLFPEVSTMCNSP